MSLKHNYPLQSLNSFGILARASIFTEINNENDARNIILNSEFKKMPKFILGSGCNIVLTGDISALVLKMNILGKSIIEQNSKFAILEAGAGENWHDFIAWSLNQNIYGLENLALIPGTVGAAPVQNIGAYGVELQDVFHELDAIDLNTGEIFTLNAAQCGFGYRDSVFKHEASDKYSMGLKNKAMILKVRFKLPTNWRATLNYKDIENKISQSGNNNPSPLEIFNWIIDIRSNKLPDPQVIGNVGSFFKNPTVTKEQCEDIIAREPKVVYYKLSNGDYKLAAGWLIDACGWRGKTIGLAGVYEKQALVLINRGTKEMPVTGGEVITLAKAIQTSVFERFGIMLEIEPDVINY